MFEVNLKLCCYNSFAGPGANQNWFKHRFHGYGKTWSGHLSKTISVLNKLSTAFYSLAICALVLEIFFFFCNARFPRIYGCFSWSNFQIIRIETDVHRVWTEYCTMIHKNLKRYWGHPHDRVHPHEKLNLLDTLEIHFLRFFALYLIPNRLAK